MTVVNRFFTHIQRLQVRQHRADADDVISDIRRHVGDGRIGLDDVRGFALKLRHGRK